MPCESYEAGEGFPCELTIGTTCDGSNCWADFGPQVLQRRTGRADVYFMNAAGKIGAAIAVSGASLNLLADLSGHFTSQIKFVGLAMLVLGTLVVLIARNRRHGDPAGSPRSP